MLEMPENDQVMLRKITRQWQQLYTRPKAAPEGRAPTTFAPAIQRKWVKCPHGLATVSGNAARDAAGSASQDSWSPGIRPVLGATDADWSGPSQRYSPP